ncbi:MAG: beta-phosphoglucomutase [Prolixibacteraceae bacterium]|nr:beta-phosphoglucomutase [Prolixibacteraceae bacterium]
MKIKACLFDLDGVIVDTAKYHFLAWKELAADLGFEFTEEHNERLKGVSRMASLDILLGIGGIAATKEEKEKMAESKNERYVSLIKKMNPDEILPGVLDFLNEIKDAGIKTAIGSASKNAPLIIDRLQLGRYFDAIIDGNNVSHAKPHPEVFLKGAEALNAGASECVVFEDAVAGIKAAVNGKMKCIGIGDSKVLREADMVIPGFGKFNLEKLLLL